MKARWQRIAPAYPDSQSLLGGEELAVTGALPREHRQKFDCGMRAPHRRLPLVRAGFEDGKIKIQLGGRLVRHQTVTGLRQASHDLGQRPWPSCLRDVEPLQRGIDQLVRVQT